MNIGRLVTRTTAKIRKSRAEQEERKTRRVILARNKATKEAERKEKLARAREELAEAKARKQKAEERLKPKDKGGKPKKKIDWYQLGVKAFAPFQPEKPKRRTTKKARKKIRRG